MEYFLNASKLFEYVITTNNHTDEGVIVHTRPGYTLTIDGSAITLAVNHGSTFRIASDIKMMGRFDVISSVSRKELLSILAKVTHHEVSFYDDKAVLPLKCSTFLQGYDVLLWNNRVKILTNDDHYGGPIPRIDDHVRGPIPRIEDQIVELSPSLWRGSFTRDECQCEYSYCPDVGTINLRMKILQIGKSDHGSNHTFGVLFKYHYGIITLIRISGNPPVIIKRNHRGLYTSESKSPIPDIDSLSQITDYQSLVTTLTNLGK